MADFPDHVNNLIGARKDVLDTPVLLLDLNAVERNILKIRQISWGIRFPNFDPPQ